MPVTSRNMAQVTPMNEKIMADTDVKTKTAPDDVKQARATFCSRLLQ